MIRRAATFIALGVLAILASAGPAAAAPAWLAPTDLSAPGRDAVEPQVAVDAGGDTVAVWGRSNGSDFIIQASSRPAGGAWTPPVDLSAVGRSATEPQVAIGPGGSAVAVWARTNGAHVVIQGASKPAGGAWTPALDLSDSERTAGEPQVAIDSAGRAVAVWQRSDGFNTIVQSCLPRTVGGGASGRNPSTSPPKARTRRNRSWAPTERATWSRSGPASKAPTRSPRRRSGRAAAPGPPPTTSPKPAATRRNRRSPSTPAAAPSRSGRARSGATATVQAAEMAPGRQLARSARSDRRRRGRDRTGRGVGRRTGDRGLVARIGGAVHLDRVAREARRRRLAADPGPHPAGPDPDRRHSPCGDRPARERRGGLGPLERQPDGDRRPDQAGRRRLDRYRRTVRARLQLTRTADRGRRDRRRGRDLVARKRGQHDRPGGRLRRRRPDLPVALDPGRGDGPPAGPVRAPRPSRTGLR